MSSRKGEIFTQSDNLFFCFFLILVSSFGILCLWSKICLGYFMGIAERHLHNGANKSASALPQVWEGTLMMAIAGENMARKIFWGLITQGKNSLCPLFFNAF